MKKREKTKTLSEIKTIVTDLIRKIPAEKSDLPAFGIAQDFAEPFIEVNEEGYSFVIMERGHELQRVHINELDDFLYIVLEDITEKISIRQAAQRNVDNVDSRRISFELQEALMADLNPEWGFRVRKNMRQYQPSTHLMIPVVCALIFALS